MSQTGGSQSAPAVATRGQVTATAAPSSQSQAQNRLAWLLLTPTLAIVAFVALWPLAQTIWTSFTNARLASGITPKFVGLDNYAALLSDGFWWSAVGTTIAFTALTVIFEFLLGLGIALVINSNFKGRGLVRTAMLIPWAIPTVISAMMWKWMYHDVYGVINDLLVNKLGILNQNVAFTSSPALALPAIAAVDIWKTTPFVALLLLAGLQVISSDVYEAATVDGASRWQQFLRITLPLLRPAIAVTLIFRTLDALRVFDVFYTMFGARPDTQTMAIYNQQYIVAFSNLGYGAAISVAIFIIIAVFVALYVRFIGVEDR
jgi:trehalose/maltose transport system permease protein